jgi:hypothetical protein
MSTSTADRNARKILDRINTLHDRVNATIYFGNAFTTSDAPWKIRLSFSISGSTIDAIAFGPTFNLALQAAWERLTLITSRGIGTGKDLDSLSLRLEEELSSERISDLPVVGKEGYFPEDFEEHFIRDALKKERRND